MLKNRVFPFVMLVVLFAVALAGCGTPAATPAVQSLPKHLLRQLSPQPRLNRRLPRKVVRWSSP